MNANSFVTAAALALSIFTASTSAMAGTRVVTSLKPIELLVRAVAPDDVTVTTLVQPGASPHSYTMKPSQRQALEQADAIFWVGPELETFLARLLGGDEFRNRTYSLMHGEDVPEVDADTDHGDHHDSGHDDHGHAKETANGHDEHDHGDGEDPHIWLDPALALSMARDIKRVLAQQDGADPAELDANLASFERRLSAAETDIMARLKPMEGVDLFTYHDAFTGFLEHYGLHLSGILTLNPELSPGARHIAEVQQKLQAANQPCLLTEPQFNRQWWRSITEGLEITFSTWDPLATDIASDRNGYIAFQHGLAEAVIRCLPENAQQ